MCFYLNHIICISVYLDHPEVITLVINRKLVMQTTRTWDYLGLFSTPSSGKGLVQGSNMGSGAVIGVIDSGMLSISLYQYVNLIISA